MAQGRCCHLHRRPATSPAALSQDHLTLPCPLPEIVVSWTKQPVQAFSLEPRSRGSGSSSDDGDAGEVGSAAGLGGALFPPRSQDEWRRQVALALQAKQVREPG